VARGNFKQETTETGRTKILTMPTGKKLMCHLIGKARDMKIMMAMPGIAMSSHYLRIL
jgi:hypothetical protein